MGFSVSGTLRSNLDPFGLYDDARLWDALKRALLVDTNEQQPPSPQTTTQGDAQVVGSRFDLDTPIDGEGSNLSVGQVRLSPISGFFLVADCCPAVTGIAGTSFSP
jgi:ABC-type multidrug transport system fused ATPase/permease subunit